MPRRRPIVAALVALVSIPLAASAVAFASGTLPESTLPSPSLSNEGPGQYLSGPSKPESSAAARTPFVLSKPKAVPPFPILLNEMVRSYVHDYVNRPGTWEGSVERSRPFFLEMSQALRARGVPEDMLYLSFAESDFSKRGKGPWQFNKGTAQKYGLRVDRWVDERRDPVLSTRAAAEYLSDLHDEAGYDWRVAVVGWNGGDLAIDRYWLLRGQNFEKFMDLLPGHTRHLMGRFMAFAFMAHNSSIYGLENFDRNAQPQYHEVPVRGGTTLSEVAGSYHTTVAKLHDLNPAILRDRVPPYAHGYRVRVPLVRTAFAE